MAHEHVPTASADAVDHEVVAEPATAATSAGFVSADPIAPAVVATEPIAPEPVDAPPPSNGVHHDATNGRGGETQPVGSRGLTQDVPRPPMAFDAGPAGCTPAQMRRFIKSRPWIPMHELRRRFGIDGDEDDVTGVSVGPRTVYVGLPEREGRMLGELLRGGDVGYELSVDPVTPIVIGVFPMRPVART